MSDVFDELGRIGLRASRAQLEALLTHATKNRLSPVQVVEHLVEIERRERDARNLASRAKKASVGPHKTMDLFDRDHPRKIDRTLCEEQVLKHAALRIEPEPQRASGAAAPPRNDDERCGTVSRRSSRGFPRRSTVDEYGTGEILLIRAMACGNQVFFFGNPKGFPKEAKDQIEDMVLNELHYFDEDDDPIVQYDTFMKLAGPYWMSCICSSEDAPVLDPDHYRTYLDRRG